MKPLPSGGSRGLADVLSEVTSHVDYLRVSLDAPAADGWLSCHALLADPAVLAESIRATASGRGAPKDMVAASLYVQAYAFRIATLVLGPFALGLPSPACTPEATAIRIARHRPAAVAVLHHDVTERDAKATAEALLAGHLERLIDVVADTFTVGRRLLWGNVAASCMTVFRALDGAPTADRLAVQRLATEFFAAATPWLDGLGRFDTVVARDRTGWYWTRNACCLWYQCSGGQTCDDCSLTAPADLLVARRAQLVGGPA